LVLIAYDGSADAKAAISEAAKLFPGETVTVLTGWHRFIDTMARMGGGVGVIVDYDEVDKATESSAQEQAAEGAKLAADAGLQASAHAAVVETTLAETILSEAAAAGAQAVVCGSRGYTGVKSLMLGSVSTHVLQHADVPVIVVPSPEVAAARAAHRRELLAS
jgi:nucleotide-binding universal stress UspA family protein